MPNSYDTESAQDLFEIAIADILHDLGVKIPNSTTTLTNKKYNQYLKKATKDFESFLKSLPSNEESLDEVNLGEKNLITSVLPGRNKRAYVFTTHSKMSKDIRITPAVSLIMTDSF